MIPSRIAELVTRLGYRPATYWDLAPGLVITQLEWRKLLSPQPNQPSQIEQVELREDWNQFHAQVKFYRVGEEPLSQGTFPVRDLGSLDGGRIYLVPAQLPHLGDLCRLFKLTSTMALVFGRLMMAARSGHEEDIVAYGALAEAANNGGYVEAVADAEGVLARGVEYIVIEPDQSMRLQLGAHWQYSRHLRQWSVVSIEGGQVIILEEDGTGRAQFVTSCPSHIPVIRTVNNPWQGAEQIGALAS